MFVEFFGFLNALHFVTCMYNYLCGAESFLRSCHSASQEILCVLWNLKASLQCSQETHHWSLSWATSIQSTTSHTIS